MKKDKYSGIKEIFRKRGFYVALYSCIAVLLVAAVLITYSSLADYDQPEQEIAQDVEIDFEDMQQTSGRGYLAPEDKNVPNVELAMVPEELVARTENQAATSETNPEEEPEATPQEETMTEGAHTQEADPPAEQENTMEPSQEEAMSDYEEDDEVSFVMNLIYPEDEVEEILADPVFSVYNGEDDMMWPVLGDVVMDYSVDRVIYDLTLEQYRTNDNICIQANAGTQVKASADGVVRNVGSSREEGNYIVIEHGNGWCTTYSQLQDGILVAEGDVVTAGQVIGGVGNPSIYSVALGSHLNFKISKDDATVNPIMVLEQ